MNSSPPVRCTHRNCGQRSKKSADLVGRHLVHALLLPDVAHLAAEIAVIGRDERHLVRQRRRAQVRAEDRAGEAEFVCQHQWWSETPTAPLVAAMAHVASPRPVDRRPADRLYCHDLALFASADVSVRHALAGAGHRPGTPTLMPDSARHRCHPDQGRRRLIGEIVDAVQAVRRRSARRRRPLARPHARDRRRARRPRHPRRGKGKGEALRLALDEATREIVVFIDADGSHDPKRHSRAGRADSRRRGRHGHRVARQGRQRRTARHASSSSSATSARSSSCSRSTTAGTCG